MSTSPPPSSHDAGEGGLLIRLIGGLTRWVCTNPGTTLGLVFVLTLIAAGISFRFLTFKTDRADLIHADAEFHQRWLRYVEKFGDQSEVVIAVEGADRAAIEQALQGVGEKLESHSDLFDRVSYQFDPSSLRSKGLQYLTPQELTQIMDQLSRQSDILEGNWERAGLESYAGQLADQLTQVNQAQAAIEAAAAQGLSPAQGPQLLSPSEIQPLLDATQTFCRSLNRSDPLSGSFLSPWPNVMSPGMESGLDQFQPHYQINEAGTMGFVLASPIQSKQDFGGSSRSLDELRRIVSEYDALHPDVSIGLTGIPVLESDEMLRSQQDMTWASVISFLGVGVIMLIGFRGLRHPLLSMVTLVVGIIWCLGYTTISVGHLNILSVSFAAILIGLGIDFSIHYLAKYLELRHHNVGLVPALLQTSTGMGSGIITAAVTTALAFFCASFTSFLGVAELGIIAGGGILICAAATFCVLPALVTLSDRKVEPKRLPTPFEGNYIRYLTRTYPGMVCLITLLAIIAIGFQGMRLQDGHLVSRVRYDANLLHLQAEGIPSVELQHRIFDEGEGSLLFAVSMTDSPENVRQLKEQFLELPSVGKVEELAGYLPKYPPAETKLLVQGIHARLARLSDLPDQFPQLDPDAIGKSLERLYLQLKQRREPVAREATAELDAYLERLSQAELGDQIGTLRAYQQALLTSLHRQFAALAAVSDPEPVAPSDFPSAIRSRFLSPQGDWLLRVYPRQQVWDEAPLEEFVTDVRSVDADVTGTPLQNYEAARQIKQSYFNASLYALAVIILTLLIDAMSGAPLLLSLISPIVVVAFAVVSLDGALGVHPVWFVLVYTVVAILVAAVFDFKSVRNTLLALGPPVLGLFMTFGILGILGIDLNPANLIVLPLILGIGVDDGVHVIHDFRHQRGEYRTAASTINAITLTSLTSMIGFGSMIIASHQGLVSLGIVLVVGVGSCLFVSLVTLPAMLTLLGTDLEAEPVPASGTEDNILLTAMEEDTSGEHLLSIEVAREQARRDIAS